MLLSTFVIAAWVGLIEKIAGATLATVTDCCAFPFPVLTLSIAAPEPISNGICALIWKGKAASTSAVSPLICTAVSNPDRTKPAP
jgi:hypothetical protein